MHEGIESPLLLQHIRRRRPRRFGFQGQVHALMATVLFGMARRDAFELNAAAHHHTDNLLRP